MKTPTCTVLMPVYNGEKFVSQAINSILNQKFSDFELLIIDDGSTDRTSEIISEIKDERIVYLRNSKNIKIVKTLNKGISIAKGRYIARMDADDIILGNRLEKQISFLESNNDYGLVGSWYQIINEAGALIQTVELPVNNDLLKLNLLFKNQFAHSSITMRTDLARRLGYKENYHYTEDYDMWCRMSRITNIANLPEYFLMYRWYEANSCSQNQKPLKSSVVGILSRELSEYNISYSIDELAVHAAICLNYGSAYFCTEEKKQRLISWLDKILSSPSIKQRFPQDLLEKQKKHVLRTYANVSI